MSIWDACRDNDVEGVERYVRLGGDINAKMDDDGGTPLIYATWHENEQVVRRLVELGANVDAQDDCGYTALMYASCDGCFEIVRFLVLHKADIEKMDFDGKTAFMLASSSGQLTVVRHLLACERKLEKKRKSRTPSSENDSRFPCGMLYAKDNNGSNAFDLACVNGRASTVLYLAKEHLKLRSDYAEFGIEKFIPRYVEMDIYEYDDLCKNAVPLYVNRAVNDLGFAQDMERSVDEILSNPDKDLGRYGMEGSDVELLTKLLKTLRSIDYTEKVERKCEEETPSYDYDMEL